MNLNESILLWASSWCCCYCWFYRCYCWCCCCYWCFYCCWCYCCCCCCYCCWSRLFNLFPQSVWFGQANFMARHFQKIFNKTLLKSSCHIIFYLCSFPIVLHLVRTYIGFHRHMTLLNILFTCIAYLCWLSYISTVPKRNEMRKNACVNTAVYFKFFAT